MAEERTRRKKKRDGRTGYFDYALVIVIFCLLMFGLVMLYSTSSYSASLRFGDASHFVKRQAAFAVGGLLVMYVVSRIDYHTWIRTALPFYLIAIALCFYVLVGGSSYNNSARWISIAGISVQPSELGKLTLIVFYAALLSRSSTKLNDMKSFLKYLLWFVPVVVPVAMANLSTAMIIAGIWFIMVFVAKKDYIPLSLFLVLAAFFAAAFILGASYRSERVSTWLHPEDNPKKAYQTLQGLYAIGSGGIFGKGLGESMQKRFVPYAENDMIFSIICEELGLFGAVCVVIMFILLIWRLLIIADNARDQFGSFIAVGVMSHIALQVVLNIAVVTNSIPNTGITLPFISYGGTALLILMVEMGIVLSVSRQIEFTA